MTHSQIFVQIVLDSPSALALSKASDAVADAVTAALTEHPRCKVASSVVETAMKKFLTEEAAVVVSVPTEAAVAPAATPKVSASLAKIKANAAARKATGSKASAPVAKAARKTADPDAPYGRKPDGTPRAKPGRKPKDA